MRRKYLIIIITLVIIILFFIIFFSIYHSKPDIKQSSFQKYDISSYFEKEGSHTIEGKGYTVEFVTTDGVTKMYIDHQMMYDAGNPFLSLDPVLYEYPNYLVYSESGFDTSIVYIYSIQEKEVIPYSYISDYGFTIENYQMKEDGILFEATKIMDDSFFVEGKQIVLDSCEKIKPYGDETVSGTFIKKYDKEKGFSDFEEVSILKLKETEKYQSLCQ